MYSKNKYDNTSVYILFILFFSGVLLSVPAIFLERFLVGYNVFSGYAGFLYIAFVVAGITEEGLKAVILLIFLRGKNFVTRMDGITYSVFIALGFACVENLLYVLSSEKSISMQISMSRALISIPGHMMFGIAMGYFISKWRFANTRAQRRKNAVLFLLVPVGLHGIFDFILMINFKFSLVLFAVFLIVLLNVNLKNIERYFENSRKIFNHNHKKKRRKIIGQKILQIKAKEVQYDYGGCQRNKHDKKIIKDELINRTDIDREKE
ncbi:MAG: PrsW family intramembrane metalloprotease [Clostridioides sp.]|nr:PrsW family intramembrane metalloprotease [Clostridioides sp.]